MPHTPLRRSAAVVGSGLLALGAAAGVAYAVTDTADAPHSQAAVMVQNDGSVVRSRGIESVTQPTAGVFCIKVTDKNIKSSESIPVATLRGGAWDSFIRVGYSTATCGNAEDTFSVLTGRPSPFSYVGASFDWVLP